MALDFDYHDLYLAVLTASMSLRMEGVDVTNCFLLAHVMAPSVNRKDQMSLGEARQLYHHHHIPVAWMKGNKYNQGAAYNTIVTEKLYLTFIQFLNRLEQAQAEN